NSDVDNIFSNEDFVLYFCYRILAIGAEDDDIVDVRTFRYKFIFTHIGSDETLVAVHIKFGISKCNLGGFDLVENTNFGLTFPPLTILATKMFKPINGKIGQIA